MSVISGIFRPVEEDPSTAKPRSLRVGQLDGFDRWALGIISVVFLLMAANFEHLKPSMSDTWYHLAIAKRMVQTGWINGWDAWHYAPIGRPHLYPPLLHIILMVLGKLTGSVIVAGQICATVFLPLSMLTIWACARRILGSRLGLLATLLPLTDLFHFVIMEAYIAGCLVNILMPLLLLGVLFRRPWWAILFLTLIYYSHLGFSQCVALGLLLFGFKYRSHFRLTLKVVSISFLFFTPWLAHVVAHLDWLPVLKQGGMPGNPVEKLLSLQNFNVVLLGLGTWGIIKAPRPNAARMIPVYMLVGFLPILFAYGGRYSMHTMPLWAILGAGVLGRLLPEAPTWRRVIGIVGLTFLPLPTLGLVGVVMPIPIPITGSHMIVIMTMTGRGLFGDEERNENYGPDCEQVAAYLKKTTQPDEVIHVNTVLVAEMVSLLADRPTDHGAWWECSKESAKLQGRLQRDWAPTSTFVCIRPEADAGSVLQETPPMPGVDHRFILGRFEIGERRAPKLSPTGIHLTRWEPLTVAGASSTCDIYTSGAAWTFPSHDNNLALISAPVPKGSFAGARLRLSSSEMDERLVLGIRTKNGGNYTWQLSIPEGNEQYRVRVVFRWMTDSAGKRWTGQPVRELYISRPPDPGGKKGEQHEQTVRISRVEMLAERAPGK